MSPLVTAAVGALTTISAVGGFLLAHAGAIKAHVEKIEALAKEFAMVRPEVASFIASVARLEAAVVARLSQPQPSDPEEVAALADATAKADALTASLSTPVAP